MINWIMVGVSPRSYAFSAFKTFLIFERANPDVFATGYQVEINLWAAQITRFIKDATSGVSDGLWAFFFVLLFLAIGYAAYRQANNKVSKPGSDDD